MYARILALGTLLILLLAISACAMPDQVPVAVGDRAHPSIETNIQTDVVESNTAVDALSQKTVGNAESPSADVIPETSESPQGPTEAQQKLLASLQTRVDAPELFNEVWLNSEPLKLEDLRGNVVMVEFWTFG